MTDSSKIQSTSSSTHHDTSAPSKPLIDLRKRIQVVECYAIEYQDKNCRTAWHNGQLTYYKTDRKVVLFGAKNVRLIECYNIELKPPEAEEENHPINKDEDPENDKDEKKKKGCTNPNLFDLSTILVKEPTLKEGNEFTFEDQFLVRINHNKFVHHKPYRIAGEDTEKAAIRKRVKSIIEGQEDIFEKSGTLSLRKVEAPKSPLASASKKPPQRIHSHLATVLAETEKAPAGP